MSNKPKLHVVVLLDATGSMQRDWPETIPAVNGYIKNLLKANDLDVRIKVKAFSAFDGLDRVRPLTKAKSGATFTPLDYKDDAITPQGTTPLNEAIAVVVEKLLSKYTSDDRVEICVVTDGLENASASGYTKARAMLAIDAAKKNGWLVKYLAATPESFRTANSLGINPGSSAQYKGANVGATLEAVARSSYSYGVSGQSATGDFTEAELRSMTADKNLTSTS